MTDLELDVDTGPTLDSGLDLGVGAVLIVTPHSSGHVPQDLLAAMLGAARDDLAARERLLRRIYLQGDPHTDVIFDVPGATALHAWASRFVVDVNRPRDKKGPNGVVKLTDFDSAPFYQPDSTPTEADIEERLRRYWDPFHAAIDRLIEEQAIELLLDGHSMSGTGPLLGPDSGAKRPAITLMTGGGADGEPRGAESPSLAPSLEPSLAPALARELRVLAEQALAAVIDEARAEVEPVVALNRPWSVDELSYQHGPPAGVPAFGLEINRDLYLDEASGQPYQERVRALRAGIISFVSAALAATRRHAATQNASGRNAPRRNAPGGAV